MAAVQRASDRVRSHYKSGTVRHQEFLVAERTHLSLERQAEQRLIKARDGAW